MRFKRAGNEFGIVYQVLGHVYSYYVYSKSKKELNNNKFVYLNYYTLVHWDLSNFVILRSSLLGYFMT